MNKRSALLRSMSAVLGTFALASVLSIPVALAQGQKVLKFVPQADLRILDPITTTAYITRNHGYMICEERLLKEAMPAHWVACHLR